MKFRWNGRQSRILLTVFCLLLFLSGCFDDAPQKPGEGFYTYDGCRDYWRIPLKFPYQISIVDTFDFGVLEKYNPERLLVDGAATTRVIEKMVQAVFERPDGLAFQSDGRVGFLRYADGTVTMFESEGELLAALKALSIPWKNLELFHNEKWEHLHRAVKTVPLKNHLQLFSINGMQSADIILNTPEVYKTLVKDIRSGYKSPHYFAFQRENDWGICLWSGECLSFETKEELEKYVHLHYPEHTFSRLKTIQEAHTPKPRPSRRVRLKRLCKAALDFVF